MRRAFTALLIAAACTSLAAQTSTAAKPSSQAPPDGTTVTVTGCLAKGEAANTFVLTNVRWRENGAGHGGHHEQEPATPPMTAPTTPSTAPADSAAKKTADDALQRANSANKTSTSETLRIAGNTTQLKLADHIGHTITATGMIAKADPVVAPGVVLPDPPSGSKPAPKPSPEASMRVLNVRSFNHVAPACD